MSDKPISKPTPLTALVSGKPEPQPDLGVNEIKRRLADFVDAKQLAILSKTLDQQDAISPLETLSKLGFDVKAMTTVQKDIADSYRDMLSQEREARREATGIAEKAKSEAQSLQLELVKLILEQQMAHQQKILEDLKSTIEKSSGKEGNKDDLSKAVQAFALQVLQESVMKKDDSDPLGKTVQQIKAIEELRQVLGARSSEGGSRNRSELQEQLELLRIQKEYELKKWEAEQKLHLEERREQNMQKLVQGISQTINAFLQSKEKTSAKASATDSREGIS